MCMRVLIVGGASDTPSCRQEYAYAAGARSFQLIIVCHDPMPMHFEQPELTPSLVSLPYICALAAAKGCLSHACPWAAF